MGDEFLSSNLDKLAHTMNKSVNLSVFGRVEAFPGMNFRTAFVAFLNGMPMNSKYRVQFQAPLKSEAECVTAAEATEEIIRLREVLRLHGFPQSGPTKLQVSVEACKLLSSSADHGVQVAKHRKLVRDQIDLLQVKLKHASDRLLKNTFSRQTKIASCAREVPPDEL